MERIIGEELQRHCWAEADLLARRKNDPVKLEMAARLRRETTLSTKAMPCGYTWPVQRPQIGAYTAICVPAE